MKNNSLAKRLLQYRVKHQLTQIQLAEKIGVSNHLICDIENEKSTVRKISIMKIEDFLDKEGE